ncbi:MAG: hypothetical protein WC513_09210 [Bacteroidales bacterium]|jgi:hypothetical protein
MNIDICTIDWVTISAFITAIMALIAGITLRQNHLQLKELKRQWEATNRARLNFSIIFNRGSFLLKITNVGKQTAYDIELKISDIIDSPFLDCMQTTNRYLQKNKFAIQSGNSKDFSIAPKFHVINDKQYIGEHESYTEDFIKQWLDANLTYRFNITGKYCSQYEINESLSIDYSIYSESMVK